MLVASHARAGEARSEGPLAGEAPQRIVSINLCSDIVLAPLAAPGTVKSVYRLSKDPADSPVASLVENIPANDGRIEDILPFAPDLVLAHQFTSPFVLDMLKRLNIPVAQVKNASTFNDIRDNIRTVAGAIGREQAGAALIARFDRALAADRRPLTPDAPGILLYQDLGGASTSNSILGRIMALTGFRNVVTRENAVGIVYPELTEVIAMHPDLVAIGVYRPDAPSLAGAVLRHPALKAYMTRHAHEIRLPSQAWRCSSHYIAGIADRMAAARDRLAQGEAP
ncbi:iron complex transport system substrate-binding protein [Parvibaculum indicum]|nr:ABC transporter substrate-binding protein [Parvibaculum indicum]NIJ42959.1 iron complex transport system substrate-binding protein [Parvibaculum indicum]